MHNYDVALSFAGEDRNYVDKVAEMLKEIGIRVFYDDYEQVDLWGKNLYVHLDEIYQKKEYILPARLNNTEIPGVSNTIGYIDLQKLKPEEFAMLIAKKVNPDIEVENMLDYLRDWLGDLSDYTIDLKGKNITFQCKREDYYGEFPLEVLLEMYKTNTLEELFLLPAIVPY